MYKDPEELLKPLVVYTVSGNCCKSRFYILFGEENLHMTNIEIYQISIKKNISKMCYDIRKMIRGLILIIFRIIYD